MNAIATNRPTRGRLIYLTAYQRQSEVGHFQILETTGSPVVYRTTCDGLRVVCRWSEVLAFIPYRGER